MADVSLDLNDIGLIGACADRSSLRIPDGGGEGSPSFALDRSGGLVCGQEAKDAWRLDPGRVRNTFWDRLGTELFPQPFAGCGSHAEIAYAHLRYVLGQINPEKHPLLVTRPSFYTRAQAGLILSMLQSLQTPCRAFLPASLAAADFSPNRPVLFLELYLHRATATLWNAQGTKCLGAGATAEAGALEFVNSYYGVAIREFLQKNRFDPARQAASEQALHNQLHALLAGHEPRLSLEHNGQTMRIDLSRDMLVEAARPQLQALENLIARFVPVAPETPVLQFGSRIRLIPGGVEFLAHVSRLEYSVRPQGAAAQGALDALHEGRIPAGNGIWMEHWGGEEAEA